MVLSNQDRKEIFAKHGISEKDTGSAAAQIAHITSRLNYLQDHFQKNKKDHHSRRGLLKLVGQRRRLLDYVKRKDIQQYRTLIADLGIRK